MSNKVLFDLTAAQTKISGRAKFHGGYIYAKTIFCKAIEASFLNFECAYNPNLLIDTKVLDTCSEHNIQLYEVQDISDIKKLIQKKRYKKFYSALPYNYTGFDFDYTKFILTLHGLRPLEISSDPTEIFYVPGILRKCKFLLNRFLSNKRKLEVQKNKFEKLVGLSNKKIVAVSEHTKYSLLSTFPKLKNDLIVSNSPVDFSLVCRPIEHKKNYFLLISANRWIKNNYRAIKAFDDLFSKGLIPDKEVVVLGVGKVDFKKYVANPGRFQFLDYVEYSALENYFNNAFCFVYPTLNEGFGYPPIQAMKYGTPVIASAIASIPEVCQNAVCYFNPYSIKELQNRILQVSTNMELYNSLRAKGFLRVEELKAQQTEMMKSLLEYIFA